MLKLIFIPLIAICTLVVDAVWAQSLELPNSQVGWIASKITGLDFKQSEIDELIKKSKVSDQFSEKKMFEILFDEPPFVNNRLATLVSRLSNEENDPFMDTDDYQVALLISATSDMDFRKAFSNPFSIVSKLNPQLRFDYRKNYRLGGEVTNAVDFTVDYQPEFDATFPHYNDFKSRLSTAARIFS